jgi:hypothetical protein
VDQWGPPARLVIDAAVRPGIPGKPDPTLIKLLIRAHHLKEKLRGSPGARIADLAIREKLSPSYGGAVAAINLSRP